MSKYYTGRYDFVFKAVLCDQDKPDLLIEFLNRLLNIKIKRIEFKNKERNKRYTSEHSKILDFIAVLDNSKIVHIELNVYYKAYMHVRNFAYFTELYSKYTKVGENYNEETNFIHIDLTYGIEENYEYKNYFVQALDGTKYIENFNIVEYNMSKLMKYWDEKNYDKIEEFKHLIMLDLSRNDLSSISKGDSFMTDYEKRLNALNDSDVWEPLMSPEEDYQKILNTEKYLARKEGLEQGREEGLEQGREQGREEGLEQGKINTAIEFINNGIDIHKVSEITKIPVETLLKESQQ